MNNACSMFHAAKAIGHHYLIILQKRYDDSPNLTFAVMGNWGKVQMAKMEFCASSGPYGMSSEWDYSYVAILNTDNDWDEEAAKLEAVGFQW